MPTMEEMYRRNVSHMDPDAMDTLFLDNSTTLGGVMGLAKRYQNLAMLSMINCNLTTLAGIPLMPQLSYLDISNNQLGDQAFFECLLDKAPVVEKISMSGNNLALGHLRPLRSLKMLSELDLANNLHLGINYRAQVFALLPQLKILDGCDIDGEEVEEISDDELGIDPPLPPPPHRRSQNPGVERVPPPARRAPHPIHHPIAQRPRQRLVLVTRPHMEHAIHHDHGREPVYIHEEEEIHEEDILVEEEVVVEEEEEDVEEYVDVDGEIGEEGGGAMQEFLDDSAFTYNEEVYYDPEDSISATIDDVIASTSGHYRQHHPPSRQDHRQQQYQHHHRQSLQGHHHHRHQDLLQPSTSSSSSSGGPEPSTSSSRGIKRVAVVAPPPLLKTTVSSSSEGEVDVEGLEPEAKKVALIEEGPSRRSDDDLNVE